MQQQRPSFGQLPALHSTRRASSARAVSAAGLDTWLERVTRLAGHASDGKWAPPPSAGSASRRKTLSRGFDEERADVPSGHARGPRSASSRGSLDSYYAFEGEDGANAGGPEDDEDGADDAAGLPSNACPPSASRSSDGDPLAFHAGLEGRWQFFRIAKSIHERPADADTVAGWVHADLGDGGGGADDGRPSTALSTVEGAAARGFLEFLGKRALPPRPILARIDLETRHLNASGAGLGDDFGTALTCVESQPIQDTFNLSVPERIFGGPLSSRRELGERIRTVQESWETSSI